MNRSSVRFRPLAPVLSLQKQAVTDNATACFFVVRKALPPVQRGTWKAKRQVPRGSQTDVGGVAAGPAGPAGQTLANAALRAGAVFTAFIIASLPAEPRAAFTARCDSKISPLTKRRAHLIFPG